MRLYLSRKFFDFEHWTGVDVIVKLGLFVVIIILIFIAGSVWMIHFCYYGDVVIPK